MMYAHYVLMSESSAKLVVMWWHGGVGSAVEIQVHCMGDQNDGWNIVKLLIVERAGQLVEKRCMEEVEALKYIGVKK